MDLQTLAEWVAEVDSIKGGARIEFRPEPRDGMTITVRWIHLDKAFSYARALSMTEMRRMPDVVQKTVLASITEAVRRQPPNAK